MNKTIIAVALVAALGLAGCSSTPKPTAAVPEDTRTAVKDTTISTDFRDQGIKVHYSITGKLEKIEVIGTAPVWKGNHTILAELDAKEKLVKFVHGEDVSSERRVRIIARSLDRAQDSTLNQIENNLSEINFNADELDQEESRGNTITPGGDDNASRRTAKRVDRTLVDAVTLVTSSGRLRGVIKIGDAVSRDGKFYTAKYEWSERTNNASEFMRSRMK